MVLVRGVLLGRLFRLGYEGLMSTVEGGADGVAIKPYVRLYTRGEARRLMEGFGVDRLSVHHVEVGRFKSTFVGKLAAPALAALEPILGWYVVCDATRG
jgi:hypothetical protein